MPRNGSGGYNPPSNSWNPPINGNLATAADWQDMLDDLSAAIQQSVSSDGQTPMTGTLQMGGNRIEGLGAPTGVGQALRWEQLIRGTDLASAATLPVPVEGQLFAVTGTATITAFADVYPGRLVYLMFPTGVILTHSANLKLPNSANITTTAGDVGVFIQESPGVWSCPFYAPDPRDVIQVVDSGSIPVTDVGPIYVKGRGVLNWNGTAYVSYDSPPLFRQQGNCSASTTAATVQAGRWRAISDQIDIRLATPLTKNLQNTGGWNAGNNQNGLFTGARAANTWYHFFVIFDPVNNLVDAGFDTSITAANRPAAYTQYRRVWSVLTDAGTNIIASAQRGNRTYWTPRRLDVSGTTVNTTETLVTLSVPLGVVVEALVGGTTGGTTNSYVAVSPPGSTTGDPASLGATTADFALAATGASPMHLNVHTNTSSQIGLVRSSAAAATATVVTLSYNDFLFD